MIVKIDGKEVDRIKLVSKTGVDKAGFKEMFKRTLKSFLINKWFKYSFVFSVKHNKYSKDNKTSTIRSRF